MASKEATFYALEVSKSLLCEHYDGLRPQCCFGDEHEFGKLAYQ